MNISYLLVISAAAMWGAIGLFSKIGGHIGFAPMEICFLRSAFAVILLGLFFAVTDRKIFKLEKITDLKYFVGTGIISFSLNNWAYIESIKETSMGVAAILLYTAPAIIMIISSVLFHEKITKIKVAALILTFMGCIFVTGIIGTENVISVRGFVFGILSAIGYGFYSIFGKIALRKYSSVTVVFYTFVMSGLFFTAMINPMDTVSKINATGSWVYVLCFAACTSSIPYILYTKGLSGIEATKASILANIEPVTAAIIGVIVFSEPMDIFKTLGIAMVVGAVCMLNLTSEK